MLSKAVVRIPREFVKSMKIEENLSRNAHQQNAALPKKGGQGTHFSQMENPNIIPANKTNIQWDNDSTTDVNCCCLILFRAFAPKINTFETVWGGKHLRNILVCDFVFAIGFKTFGNGFAKCFANGFTFFGSVRARPRRRDHDGK